MFRGDFIPASAHRRSLLSVDSVVHFYSEARRMLNDRVIAYDVRGNPRRERCTCPRPPFPSSRRVDTRAVFNLVSLSLSHTRYLSPFFSGQRDDSRGHRLHRALQPLSRTLSLSPAARFTPFLRFSGSARDSDVRSRDSSCPPPPPPLRSRAFVSSRTVMYAPRVF